MKCEYLNENYDEIESSIKRNVEDIATVYFVPLHGSKGRYASISIVDNNGEVQTMFDAWNQILSKLESISYSDDSDDVENLADCLFNSLIKLFDVEKFNFENTVNDITSSIKEIIK